MKNFTFFAICLVGLLFTSCNNDETEVNKLIGTWNLIGLDYNGTAIAETADIEIESELSAVGKNFDSEIAFNADGTYTSSGMYTVDLTQTTQGIEATQTVNVPSFVGSGEYTLDDEMNPTEITFTQSTGETVTGNITLLNENELKFTTLVETVEVDATGLLTTTTSLTVNHSLEK